MEGYGSYFMSNQINVQQNKKSKRMIIAKKTKFCGELAIEKRGNDQGIITLDGRVIAHISQVVNFVQIIVHEEKSEHFTLPNYDTSMFAVTEKNSRRHFTAHFSKRD